MIDRLVIFGATGDLNARFLLPGLAALRAAGEPADGFQLLCAGQKDWDDQEFRNWASEQLDRHGRSFPASARTWSPAPPATGTAAQPGGARPPRPEDRRAALGAPVHRRGRPPPHPPGKLPRGPDRRASRTRLPRRGRRGPRSRTETFAEVELHLESWRWSGTTFRLRTGKALKQDRKEVAVRFRPVPHLPFGHTGEARPNVLRFGLDPEDTTLALTGVGSGARALTPLTLTARMEPPDLPAYGRLLLDVLRGNAALSIRGDEAEEAWRVLAPVMSAWAADRVPLQEYPAGSDGSAPTGGSARRG